jgi:EmrB/QacA subfamily drug resistance transporter
MDSAPVVDAPAPPRFTHAQVLRVISGILLCIFLAAIDQTVVIPAVPAIAAELHGFDHLSWIITAYLLTSTAATPVYGKLSDTYGRRAMLLPAIALFVAASMLCGFARTPLELIGARALQGLGGGGLMAMAQAAIADVVSPRERGRYQGYMAGSWAVASIAGPVVGGWMTDQLSWRWIFWCNLPIGLLAFVLCERGLRLLPVRGLRSRIDWAGAGLLAAATTFCLMVLTWGGTAYPWLSAPVLGAALATLILLGLLVAQERRAADPLMPGRLFANAVFVRGVLVASIASSGTFAAIFLLPLFFQLLRGASAEQAGTLIVPYLAFNVAGAYAAGQAARWLGRGRPILLAGLLLAAAGFMLLGTLSARSPQAVALAGMAVMGFGIGACMPTSLVIVQNAAERRDVGAATGTLLFLRSLGGAFGSALSGSLLAGRVASAGGRAADLAALRGHGAAAIPAALRGVLQAGLARGFHAGFMAQVALLAVAVAICLGLRDLALRSRN